MVSVWPMKSAGKSALYLSRVIDLLYPRTFSSNRRQKKGRNGHALLCQSVALSCSSRRQCPKLFPCPCSFLPSFGHNAFLRSGDTDKKWRNPKNARLRHHWTCQEGFRKNGGRFGNRSPSHISACPFNNSKCCRMQIQFAIAHLNNVKESGHSLQYSKVTGGVNSALLISRPLEWVMRIWFLISGFFCMVPLAH